MNNAELYEYSEDINWEECEHKRPKVHELKDEWEEDLVDVTIECKDCHRIGLVRARLDYEGDVNWGNESIQEEKEE